jgi:hypothetical protein
MLGTWLLRPQFAGTGLKPHRPRQFGARLPSNGPIESATSGADCGRRSRAALPIRIYRFPVLIRRKLAKQFNSEAWKLRSMSVRRRELLGHTSLLPISILRTESAANFVDRSPTDAVRKVYISWSIKRNLKPGDAIIFYRTNRYFSSVVTAVVVIGELPSSKQTLVPTYKRLSRRQTCPSSFDDLPFRSLLQSRSRRNT